MNNKLPLLIPGLILIFFLGSPPVAHASMFDDIMTGAKQFVSSLSKKDIEKKEFKIDSDITLAPGGDVDKNKYINSGDIVRFTYTITNNTDTAYSFATIRTNIDRKQINFIHNVTGTANLNDDGKTITIPNLRVGANQMATITFDARVNYYTKEDPTISTEANFISKEIKSVAKSEKKSIKVNRIDQKKIPKMINPKD